METRFVGVDGIALDVLTLPEVVDYGRPRKYDFQAIGDDRLLFMNMSKEREADAGELRLQQGVGLFLVLMSLALLLVLLTNVLTVKLALIGALLASSYPFFKRFTHVPQIVLGIAFGWGIPMAFAAETGAVPMIAWWLLAINAVWSVVYDTQYAMVDRANDLAVGVKSTAILFGRHDVPIIAALMTAVLAFGRGRLLARLAWPWFGGVLAAAALFGWQLYLIGAANDKPVFALSQQQRVRFALFLGLLAHYFYSGALVM
jgi:4-hydroxybenzoate polyprenyltransferase